MAADLNRVTIIGNLTRDPELRSLPTGNSVCSLRIAVNGRRKDQTGEWHDFPNYFDVTVWGKQGENVARFLSKGKRIGIDGRLQWREWEDNNGNKRQAVDIVAENTQFLTPRSDDDRPVQNDLPMDNRDFAPAGQQSGSGGGYGSFGGGPDDDDSIPF